MQMEFNEVRFTGSYLSTAIVEAVPDLSVEVARGQQRPQAHTEEGVPVWTVEVMQQVTEFGRRRTDVFTVRVPAPQRPVLAAGPVRFKGLRAVVSTRVQRSGSGRDARITGVTETVYWDADGVEQVRQGNESKGAA